MDKVLKKVENPVDNILKNRTTHLLTFYPQDTTALYQLYQIVFMVRNLLEFKLKIGLSTVMDKPNNSNNNFF